MTADGRLGGFRGFYGVWLGFQGFTQGHVFMKLLKKKKNIYLINLRSRKEFPHLKTIRSMVFSKLII